MSHSVDTSFLVKNVLFKAFKSPLYVDGSITTTLPFPKTSTHLSPSLLKAIKRFHRMLPFRIKPHTADLITHSAFFGDVVAYVPSDFQALLGPSRFKPTRKTMTFSPSSVTPKEVFRSAKVRAACQWFHRRWTRYSFCS